MENGRYSVANVIESTGARSLLLDAYSVTCLDNPAKDEKLPGGKSKWDPYDSSSLRVICPYCGNDRFLVAATLRRIIRYAAEEMGHKDLNGVSLETAICHTPIHVRMDYAVVAGRPTWIPYLYCASNLTKTLIVIRADADLWCWECDASFRWIIPRLWGREFVAMT